MPLLTRGQEALLRALAVADAKHRPDREPFFFIETFGGAQIIHSGFSKRELNAYRGDIEALGDAGLLRLTPSQGGYRFDITAYGFKAISEPVVTEDPKRPLGFRN